MRQSTHVKCAEEGFAKDIISQGSVILVTKQLVKYVVKDFQLAGVPCAAN